MNTFVKSSMLAVMAALFTVPAYPASPAAIKLSRACQVSYQKWKRYGGAKAFVATVDGAHCGYSYGRPNISFALKWAMLSCNKYGGGQRCVPFE